MTEQDPYGDATRVDVPATDPTMAMPAATGGRPPGSPPPTGGRSGDGPDRRGWILAGLLAAVVLAGLAALLVGDDDESTASGTSTTTSTTVADTSTTSSSTTTTPSTTTTAPPATTTTAPPVTVAPALCTSGEPDDPDHSVQVLYQAYTVRDRDCAEAIATDDAVDSLFSIPGYGDGWEYQGCTEQDVPDPHLDCAYTFTGGATHLRIRYSETDGWVAYEVYQTAD